LTRWSLPRLAGYLADQGIVQISPVHLGRVLAEANLSFQRTRTWKASPNPATRPRPHGFWRRRASGPPTAAS
jgi:hypothetical protein